MSKYSEGALSFKGIPNMKSTSLTGVGRIK